MKFLHTSDLHFGVQLGQRSLADLQAQMTDAMIRLCRREQVDAVVVAGDLYDRTNPSDQAIDLFNRFMSLLCLELQCPVYAIAGNHDHPARLGAGRALLAKAGLYLSTQIKDAYTVHHENVCFHFFPYFHPHQVVYDHAQTSSHQMHEAMKSVAQSSLQRMKNQADYHVAIAHGFLQSATLSGSETMARTSVGDAERIGSEAFEGYDYVAMGHLHQPQQLGKHIFYSGSPAKYQFSEWDRPKGALIHDTETRQTVFHPLPICMDFFEWTIAYESLIGLSREAFCDQLYEAYLHAYQHLEPKQADQLCLMQSSVQIQRHHLNADHPPLLVRIALTDVQPSLERLNQFKGIYSGVLSLAAPRQNSAVKRKDASVIKNVMEQHSPLDWLNLYYQRQLNRSVDDVAMRWFQEATLQVRE